MEFFSYLKAKPAMKFIHRATAVAKHTSSSRVFQLEREYSGNTSGRIVSRFGHFGKSWSINWHDDRRRIANWTLLVGYNW